MRSFKGEVKIEQEMRKQLQRGMQQEQENNERLREEIAFLKHVQVVRCVFITHNLHVDSLNCTVKFSGF
jgi:hypothetical protein